MKVICDQTEKKSGMPKKLKKYFDKVIVKKLKYGDYQIKYLTLERKTMSQFLTDWYSGQLDKQIANLIEKTKMSCLIVEDDAKLPIKERLKIEKRCQTLSAFIWIIFTFKKKGTVNAINYYAKKIYSGELLKFKRPVGVRGRKNDIVNFLCGFAKIDEVKAKRLLKKYKTISRALANVKNWVDDIKGIGNKIQNDAIRLLNKKYKK